MCKEEGVLLCSGKTPIKTYMNDKNEEKKEGSVFQTSGLGFAWREQTQSNFNPRRPTHIVICGEKSGLTVIDWDDESTYKKYCKKYPDLNDRFTVKTKNGYHTYGLYNSNLKTTTNIIPTVDIRNDNSIVIAPPTRYKVLNGDEYGYEVKNIVDKLKTPFPQELVDYLISQQEKRHTARKKEAKKPEFIQQLREEAEHECPKPEFIRKCLAIITDEYKNNFDSYYRIVVACSRWKELKEDCRKALITEQYPKNAFTDAAFEEWWFAYQGKQSCGLATICSYAKASNPKAFAKLYLELPDNYETTNFGMANVALTLLDDLMLWDDENKVPVVLDEDTQYWNILDSKDTRCEYMIMNALQIHYNNLLGELSHQIDEIDEEEQPELWRKTYAKYHTIQANLTQINTQKTLENVSKMFKMILPRQNGKDMRFGVVPHLLPFKNGMVLDLNKVEMRKATRDDLITRHTNTIYEEPDDEAVAKMRRILSQILPKPEYYKTYMNVLWSALYGRMPEKIVFAKGHGRNGKSKINTQLLRGILGERTEEGGLYFTGEITSLMGKEQGGGANPAMANLDGMRAAIYGEPPAYAKFSANRIKLMTGQHTINARRLYSNKTKTDVYATYILEVNKLSKMDDDGVSLEDRIIIVPFISYFTNDENIWNEEQHIYPKDEHLDVWLDANWNACLKILMEHAKTMDRTHGINLHEWETPEMREEVKDYVSRGNDLFQFVSDNYNLTDDDSDQVRIQDLRTKYIELTRRKVSSADFLQMLKDNNLLKDRIKMDKTVKGKRVRRMMVRMKEAFDDNEFSDEEEECDDI